MTPLAPLVTGFFRKHLAIDKGVSKNTITSYSYSFKFLCRYISDRLNKSHSQLPTHQSTRKVVLLRLD